ncbi:1-phosphatidylinositol 4,5-bisphosphate phosphodiesterase delta-3 isoform X1 [Strigops habroptila]|uniref:1-phosphatidylinositol 4,5-bisphosphate phosphodiesterase delta-3 isoform X1 n=2 Tax=Strigops habroptila TaxID=2489341 RepID=UPI0011CED422|nr:1-phosphatidylinositol 4,5-bisphosphate phosphodiesterase delta-3 isoform X1 [Strigops habroptila]
MICGWKARPAVEQPRSPSDGAGGPRRPGRALKKMGLTEDEDIQRMLRGSLLRKIKSRGSPRERLFRLQEDGATVCFEGRFRRARAQRSFSVMHIEGVREGHQSEGLRKHGAAFPAPHCFTLTFKGKRKNLDLAARSEEDARHWVQGLTKLMGRLQAMSQPEKLDHWIHGVLQRADRNKDNKMSFQEVKSMLRMINIDMNDVYAYKLFKDCDCSGDERLEGRELEEFCRRLLRRPELEEVFGHYSGEDRVLSAEELRDFLRDQGEDASLRQARAIIRSYELNEKARQQDFMTLDGFMMYLLSAAGDILNQEHTKVHQDMSQPLCHYFISSSHNTYLTHHQIGGTSSTEAYVRALAAGCRCVELDCWEGAHGEPVVYHGHALTSKILFRDVIESIRDYAFKQSPYPVILSLENHCGLEQQVTMARHMRSILGDMLLTEPLEGQDPHDLPSPEQLKGKILVKGKKLPEPWHEPQDVTSLLDPEEEEEEEEEEEDEEKLKERNRRRSLQSPQESKPLQAKDASEVAAALSAMVVYCQAVPFPGLAHALRHPRPCEISSFSERKARKLIREAGPALVQYNTRQLSRVYPLGLKMNSSNYNPQEMWNAGCQLVALNFQTPGYEMDLNTGRFLGNGGCGYVLKPPCLRSPPGDGPGRLVLHVRVITAQQLPKLSKDKASSIVDPFVRVEVHGVAADCSKQQTHHKLNNGFNPRWDETLSFELQAPDLALLRFVVEDHDSTSCNDFVGQFTLPMGSLREGYRHIHLLSKDGTSLSPATLFVHVRCKSL